MGSIRDELGAVGAQAIAVAVTATFSQMAFAQAVGAEFPMLSDWEGEVCEAYGVRYDTWKGHSGLAKRSVFVVDPSGVIRYRWITEQAEELPDLRVALAVLEGLST